MLQDTVGHAAPRTRATALVFVWLLWAAVLAGFVFFFTRVGMTAPDALALSFLFLGLAIAGNMPGGLLVAFGRSRRPAPA